MTREIIFFLLTGLYLSSYAQNKFSVGIQADLFSLPISDVTYNVVPGIYHTSGKAETNVAFYGEFFYWPHRNIGFYLGAGIHSYNYHAEFEIPDPETEGDFLFDEYRKLQAVAWSPVLGVTFRTKKFMGKIGVVAFDPTDVKTSAESNAATHLFFSSNQTNAVKVLYIKEDISFVGEPDAFKMIQASVHYGISKNIFMHAGIEFTTDKFSTYHYRLYIKEYPPDDPTMSTVANDFRITTNYTAVTLGMSYNLGFGKYNQRTNE